jgi:hypothetical protein
MSEFGKGQRSRMPPLGLCRRRSTAPVDGGVELRAKKGQAGHKVQHQRRRGGRKTIQIQQAAALNGFPNGMHATANTHTHAMSHTQ